MNAALMCHDNVCFRLQNGQPKFNQNVSYHLENKRFVEYLEQLTDEAHVDKIDDIVDRVVVGKNGIEKICLQDCGQEISADLFVDCSGFRAELIGKKRVRRDVC